jgi:DNA-binding beta-propeller fold protein YncE
MLLQPTRETFYAEEGHQVEAIELKERLVAMTLGVRRRLSNSALLIVNSLLALEIIHDSWFLEKSQSEFLAQTLEQISLRAGQAVIVASLVVMIAKIVRRGTPAPIKQINETVSQWIVDMITRPVRDLPRYRIATLCQVVLAVMLGFWWYQTSPRFFPPLAQEASQILITPDGYIYTSNPTEGTIEWSTVDAPLADTPPLRVYTAGGGAEIGNPVRLALLSQTKWSGRESGDKILATDEAHHELLLIDRRTYQVLHVPLGVRPERMVVTPDATKAYIGTEQPIPSGSITVVDLSAKPLPRIAGQITGLGCPEGMAIAGDHLYVATQCGWGNDPVFVINTATDQVEGKLPGLATGSLVTVALRREPFPWLPREKIYATKSPEHHPELSRLAEFDVSRLSRARKIKEFSLRSGAMTPTSDGRQLLVFDAATSHLTIIDVNTDNILPMPGEVAPLPPTLISIAVARIGQQKADKVYALFANSNSAKLELRTWELNSVLP